MVETTRTATVRTLEYEGALQRLWDFPPATGVAGQPAIFMVHGFRGDHHGLLRIVEALPQHRVIVPDLPGFGASGALKSRHDDGAYARFVGFAFDSLALGKETVLLGHSFGSVVASRFAAKHPTAISRLVLVNPICEPALEGQGRLATGVTELYYRAGAGLPERVGTALLANRLIIRVMSTFMAKTSDRDLRKYIHGQHRAYFGAFADRRVVCEAYQASTTGTVRDSAAGLTMPVLLIAAEKDDIGSIPGQRMLAAMMPDSTLHIIPNVGHLIHYETPDAAARLITDFLQERNL